MTDFRFVLEPLGWAIAHMLWIGTAVGAVMLVINLALRSRSAKLRYAANFSGLLLLAASVPLVAWFMGRTIEPSTAAAPPIVMADLEAQPNDTAAAVLNTPVGVDGPEPEHSTAELSPATIADAPAATESAVARSSEPAVVSDDLAPSIAESASAIRKVEPEPTSNKSRPAWPVWVAFAYCIGTVIMLTRLCVSLMGSHRLRRCCEDVEGRIQALCREQAQRLGLRTAPVLKCCERVVVPIVLGTLRPLVLLPTSMMTGLTESELRSVLVHELAHIRRFDHFAIAIQRLAEIVLFFHPVAWYLSRQVNLEREHCCDDLVIATGVSRVEYANALCKVAETLVPRAGTPGLAIDGRRPSRLRGRINRVLGVPQSQVGFGLSGTLMVSLLLVGTTFAAMLSPLKADSDSTSIDALSITEAAQEPVAVPKSQTGPDKQTAMALGQLIKFPTEPKSLATVLASIAEQADFELEITQDVSEQIEATQIGLDDMPHDGTAARIAFKELLSERALNYEVLADRIVVRSDRIRGTVVDEDGAPIVGAAVCIAYHRPRCSPREDTLLINRSSSEPEFDDLVQTDDQGRFEIRAWVDPGFRFTIWAEEAWSDGSAAPCLQRPGNRRLTVRPVLGGSPNAKTHAADLRHWGWQNQEDFDVNRPATRDWPQSTGRCRGGSHSCSTWFATD